MLSKFFLIPVKDEADPDYKDLKNAEEKDKAKETSTVKKDFSMPITTTIINITNKLDKNGNKYPKEEPKDKFSERMATFFLFRPVFGILAGLLIFFGIQTNYFLETGIENESKVIFWSLLSGLFIKTLIEKLKDLFDSLVGKK
jgi:hypothetical protein